MIFVMSYFGELLFRAFSDTWEVVIGNPLSSALVAGAIVSIQAWMIWQKGGKDKAKELLLSTGQTCIAIAALFTAIFVIFFLFISPKRLVEESRKSNDSTRKERDSLNLKANELQSKLDKKDLSIKVDMTDLDARERLQQTTDQLIKTQADLKATQANLLQADAKIAKLDPLQQPIVSIKISASLTIPSDKGTASNYLDRGAEVHLGRGATSLLIGTTTHHLGNGKGQRDFLLDGSEQSAYMNHPIKDLADAEYIQMAFPESVAPKNTEVTGGEIIITVNNQVRLRFAIPKQVISWEKTLDGGEKVTSLFIRDIKNELRPLH